MSYKVYLYVFFTLLSLFALNGVNISKIMRTNRIWEARILVLSLSFIMGHLLSQFVINFIEASAIF